MGLCASVDVETKNEIKNNVKIQDDMNKEEKKNKQILRLLFLGTGESGKSTIFKQMQIISKTGFSGYEKNTYRHVVRRNALEAMQTLVKGCEKFKGCDLKNPPEQAAAKFLMSINPLEPDFWVKDIAQHIKYLWEQSEAIHLAFMRRANLQLVDSAEYLFSRLDAMDQADYIPTEDDILRARLRTSGIVERVFRIHDTDFTFIDVGGQRNERRKWIHCFESVTAVIFVAAISEYNQKLYEEDKENRLLEAINVFDKICNNQYFLDVAMILFLNKIDIFAQKVKQEPITTLFPEYKGPLTEDDQKEYIRSKFLEVCTSPTKDIFTHYTCATDTTQVDRVFDACRKVILKQHLLKLGLA